MIGLFSQDYLLIRGYVMKRILLFAVVMGLLIAGLISWRNKEEIMYIGVNAEILEINTELKGFVVKSLDENSILGEKCYISCENPEMYFIYADNDTREVQNLTYEDFLVGDEITVDIKSVENK